MTDVYLPYYKKGEPISLPLNIAKQFIAAATVGFNEIEKVSRIPGLDKEINVYGRESGYHAKTKTYFLNDFTWHRRITNEDEAKAAIDRLLEPFSMYRIADEDKGRAVILAAVLTSILRPMLTTAPGIAIHTPMGGQSTGKTPMAEALAACGGWGFAGRGWGHKAENDKALHAHLVGSGAFALYFDNVTGSFGSDVLAAVLTSPTYVARELGKTKDLPVATNVLIMMSGNAYEPTKDMAVRMLEIGLAPQKISPGWMPIDKVDHGEFVSLAFALAEYVRANFNRVKIMAAAPNGKFPHWDAVVRFPVAALTGHNPMSISDERGLSADWDDNFEILAVLDNVWNETTPDERRNMTSSQIEFHADSAAVELATDKFKMKTNRFAFVLAKFERNRNSTSGGIIGDYLLEVIADRKNDGVETKRYRPTKPHDASKPPQSFSNVVLFADYASEPVAETSSDDLANMRVRIKKKSE